MIRQDGGKIFLHGTAWKRLPLFSDYNFLFSFCSLLNLFAVILI